eukprot:1155956-Pelagomonas_calceolata.AAC.2
MLKATATSKEAKAELPLPCKSIMYKYIQDRQTRVLTQIVGEVGFMTPIADVTDKKYGAMRCSLKPMIPHPQQKLSLSTQGNTHFVSCSTILRRLAYFGKLGELLVNVMLLLRGGHGIVVSGCWCGPASLDSSPVRLGQLHHLRLHGPLACDAVLLDGRDWMGDSRSPCTSEQPCLGSSSAMAVSYLICFRLASLLLPLHHPGNEYSGGHYIMIP